MTVTSTGRTIELEVTILATPAEIWKALSTADGLARWFSSHRRRRWCARIGPPPLLGTRHRLAHPEHRLG
jgi:uncharacterized protein YndB with AHSA1/START domain